MTVLVTYHREEGILIETEARLSSVIKIKGNTAVLSVSLGLVGLAVHIVEVVCIQIWEWV